MTWPAQEDIDEIAGRMHRADDAICSALATLVANKRRLNGVKSNERPSAQEMREAIDHVRWALDGYEGMAAGAEQVRPKKTETELVAFLRKVESWLWDSGHDSRAREVRAFIRGLECK